MIDSVLWYLVSAFYPWEVVVWEGSQRFQANKKVFDPQAYSFKNKLKFAAEEGSRGPERSLTTRLQGSWKFTVNFQGYMPDGVAKQAYWIQLLLRILNLMRDPHRTSKE